MSDATPTSTPTETQPTPNLIPLTTPFIPSPSCDPAQAQALITQAILTTWNNATYTTDHSTFLASDPANSNYGACQPSGYKSENSQSFSPAVCPDGWAAMGMATTLGSTIEISSAKTGFATGFTTRTVSTAWCCKVQYTFVSTTTGALERLGPFCLEPYKVHDEPTPHSTLPAASSGGVPQIFSRGREVHPAWHIAWEKSDLEILDPRPPDLTSAMRIPTWTAGQTLYPGLYDNNGAGRAPRSESDHSRQLGMTYGIVIALPIVVFLLLVGCCGCCCWKRRKRRKGDVRAAAAAFAAEEERGRERAREREERVREDEAPPPVFEQGDGPPRFGVQNVVVEGAPPAYELHKLGPVTR